MKNIILLTHGDFSKGIAQSSRFIVGEVKLMTSLSITLNESIEETREMIEMAWKSFDNNLPTVIVTDLPGGSTTQAAIKTLPEHNDFYLVSGLNLGLLLELIMLPMTDDRVENLKQIKQVIESARTTITLVDFPAMSQMNVDNDAL